MHTALAFGDRRLFLPWSLFEPRHFLNILPVPVAADGTLLAFDENRDRMLINDWTNDTTGPSLAFSPADHRLYLAFTGADDHLYVTSSADHGRTWSTVRVGQEKSRHDAGPAIAAHDGGLLCLCWVGADGS